MIGFLPTVIQGTLILLRLLMRFDTSFLLECRSFSFLQTVAIIPVCPHGVVQFGSSLPIAENVGFVNNVKSLILQLGCVPGALLSDSHEEQDLTERIGIPVSFGLPGFPHLSGNYKVPSSTSLLSETWKQQNFSSQASSRPLLGHVQDNLKTDASVICDPKVPYRVKAKNNVNEGGAQVITSTPEAWLNHQAANSISHHPITGQKMILENGSLAHFGNTVNTADSFTMMRAMNGIGNLNSSVNSQIKQTSTNGNISEGRFFSSHPAGNELLNINSSRAGGEVSGSGMFADGSSCRFNPMAVNHSRNLASQETKQKMDNELFQAMNLQSNQLNGSASCEFTDSVAARNSYGDDLYDILGVDFRNKLLSGKWNNLITDGSQDKSEILVQDNTTYRNENGPSSCLYPANEGMSNNTTDHLLDAVVSRAHSSAKQNSDDSNSCRTTLTKASSTSVPCGPRVGGQVSTSDQVKREFLDLGRGRTIPKDDIGSCSQTTSVYGSQLSSLSSHNGRRDNSVSTAFSKKTEDGSKPNRKRLKPGENPKPRPKDRQMIQDRVKELREIVPNGAKCSIDALLERTIKHMLFLQSVTKHADKLKQTGESKLIRKDGELRVKDNFDGGATWAFEVGSQSMVCPIVVEDLSPPRQMLVEMLCEERGFFLEIAELIRGLGLTILKGVMEARNDKVWARFIVEANRDVTRMEIFMSLVHLLEQTMKGSGSSANLVESFGQASSIPASSRPISLQ
ncbi:Transcription factor LHW [Linum perenne]